MSTFTVSGRSLPLCGTADKCMCCYRIRFEASEKKWNLSQCWRDKFQFVPQDLLYVTEWQWNILMVWKISLRIEISWVGTPYGLVNNLKVQEETVWPWRWWPYDPSERQQPRTQGHSLTLQNTWIFRTWKLPGNMIIIVISSSSSSSPSS